MHSKNIFFYINLIPPKQKKMNIKVGIIGAGLSGLTAAR